VLPSGYYHYQSYAAGLFPPTGPRPASPPANPQDIYRKDGEGVRAKEVKDGTSRTIAIVESSCRVDGDWQWANGDNAFAQHDPIHAPPPPTGGGYSNEMCSDHKGGVHVVMGDGHVIFFTERTPLSLIDKLSTRARGETVEDREFN
jgi:prepilin-type processing-associated H-X9-DG protein